MKNYEQYTQTLINEKEIFFNFMKEKYPIFFNSNIFYRDIQYAIKSFFEKRNSKINFSSLEIISKELVKHLESSGELVPLNNITWKVNFSNEKAVLINEQNEPVS